MKIALLMDISSPPARALALMLSGLGHEVHAIDFANHRQDPTSWLPTLQIDGIHWIEGGLPFINRSGASNLHSILQNLRVSFLVCLSAGRYGQLAWASGFRPYALYAMGSDILLLKNPVARVIIRRVLRNASAIFANGEYLAQKTRELAPGVSVKSLLIGVDPCEFQPGVPDAKIHLLNTRNFTEINNNRYIIEAFSLLRNLPDFEFHFASHGPLLEETKTLARRMLPGSIYQRFKFWGGVTREQMQDLLHRSHFFVSMSRSDGTATSLLEAMSCGLYPILSDIPQNRDWINPLSRENGILAPLDDPGALASALTLALHKPEIVARARQLNRTLIEARADSRQHSARFACLLESLAFDPRSKLPTSFHTS